MQLLAASGLVLYYGNSQILAGIDFEVTDRAHIGVVGANGSGKTSLLRIIVGELEPDAGSLARSDGLRVGYVPQNPASTAGGTLGDEIMGAFDELRRLEDELAASAKALESATEESREQAYHRYAESLHRFEALGGYDYQHRLDEVVAIVGLSAETLATPFAAASGGERTRAALARALLSDPDLLIMDEPTNYLDFDGLTWLEEFLGRFPRAFIVVSHDRYFLDRVTSEIWELEQRRLKVFPGNYTRYRALKAEQVKRQQREYERQQEYIAKEEEFIRRYRSGQRAREARGRATRLERIERMEAPIQERSVALPRISAGRTGEVVLATRNLEVGYVENGQRVRLLSMPDIKLERGSRTAIVGRNGTGKTTLLRTILGLTPPLSGSVNLGHNVRLGYYQQGLDYLPEDSFVIDALLDASNVPLGDARTYLARFLFLGDDVFKPVAALSGGERSRLALARLLINEPNVLILDEPTTHLDIPSREALEQVLQSYEGAMLFVSHDRHLISLLARQLWLVDDGTLRVFPGTYEEWRRSQQATTSALAAPARPTPRRTATPDRQQSDPGQRQRSPEQAIRELETLLQEIEQQLLAASERQDVAEVARLGQEYDQVRARLELLWEEWAAASGPEN